MIKADEAEPEAQAALDLIRDVYVVEHDVRDAGVEGTAAHLSMRTARTRPLMARLLVWARARRRTHGPNTLLGKAAGYIVRNRRPLTRFLYVAKLPPDNNRSEAALRHVALGRKNYLFVGDEDAGENIAGLFTVVASCVHNGINLIDCQRHRRAMALQLEAGLMAFATGPDLHLELEYDSFTRRLEKRVYTKGTSRLERS